VPAWARQVIDTVVGQIVGWLKPKKLKYLVLSLEDGTMQRVIKIGQTAKVNCDGVDAVGNLTSFEGVPLWTNSDTAVGTLAPATDGRSAVFTATGMGTTQVNASMGAIHAKEAVDFIVEAGPLAAFVLSVEPNVG
jgi:hypothetical protein